MSGCPRLTFQAMTASRTSPTLCVLVIMIGPSTKPESSTQVVPVISPLPLSVNQPPKTASLDSLPRGRMAVTPVRTGPSPTLSFPLPEMRVAWPTSTPLTSVMAFRGPGWPSKGTPRSRARGLLWVNASALAIRSRRRVRAETGTSVVLVIERSGQRTRQYKASKGKRWFTIQPASRARAVFEEKTFRGEDMENWKRAVIAGSAGAATILMLKGKRPAGVLVAGVGLAVLASEYPEKFERIREEIPIYVRQGTRLLDLAMKIGARVSELVERRGRGLMEELEQYS